MRNVESVREKKTQITKVRRSRKQGKHFCSKDIVALFVALLSGVIKSVIFWSDVVRKE